MIICSSRTALEHLFLLLVGIIVWYSGWLLNLNLMSLCTWFLKKELCVLVSTGCWLLIILGARCDAWGAAINIDTNVILGNTHETIDLLLAIQELLRVHHGLLVVGSATAWWFSILEIFLWPIVIIHPIISVSMYIILLWYGRLVRQIDGFN